MQLLSKSESSGEREKGRKKGRQGQERRDWSSEKRMKVFRQYAACYVLLWVSSHFCKSSCAELQGSQTSQPWEPHTSFVFTWLRATRLTLQTQGLGEATTLVLESGLDGMGHPGALPDLQWEGTGVGLQLCEAESLFGSLFLSLPRRKKLAQSSGSYITAVGTGMILDMCRGTKTSNNCFK